MKVAILGAGAAGLLSAQALHDLGIEYRLFDKETPTVENKVRGLHYLHKPCGLDLNIITVHNYVLGVNKGEIPHLQYSRKLGTPKNNSLVDLPAFNAGYDFKQAMEILVSNHADKTEVLSIRHGMAESMLNEYDYVISTVPLNVVFPEAKCEMVEVQVKEGRPEGISGLVGLNDNQVIYNINESVNWYRYSNVLGNEWTEVVTGGDFTIPKLRDTDFVSPNDRIILQGRYGAWNRKFLAHHAYEDTIRRFGNGF